MGVSKVLVVGGGIVLTVSAPISPSTYITSLYFAFFVPVLAHSSRWVCAISMGVTP